MSRCVNNPRRSGCAGIAAGVPANASAQVVRSTMPDMPNGTCCPGKTPCGSLPCTVLPV